ncbi:hypothetical protein FACS18948_4610 [Clostridia bacterium]|nr:hypothetical protein FACS18948_4610 [Clostridia bacterium]
MKKVLELAQCLRATADALEVMYTTDGVNMEQVRAALALKSQAGFGVQVRALLAKHGAPKLSEIDPTHYADLLVETQAIT